MGPTPCDVYCAEGNCMRKQPCPANEVWGNDKLTQSPSNADLREAIEKIFSKHKSTKHIHENNSNYWPLFADLIALFQAREQQLLTELLGELPEESKQVRGNSQNPENDKYRTRYGKGFNDCRTQVVSVIERLQNKTNDGGSNGG